MSTKHLKEETPAERIDRQSKANVAKQKAASDAKKAKAAVKKALAILILNIH